MRSMIRGVALGMIALTGAPSMDSRLYGQEKDEPEVPECECPMPFGMRFHVPGDDEIELALVGQRPRLGVLVHGDANPETDSIGALIDAVTPGGPADEAGLRGGDIITRLDGKSLVEDGGAVEPGASAPGRNLVARARELEPGDTVTVEYRRDGERRTATIVAGDAFTLSHLRRPFVEVHKLLERFDGLGDVEVHGDPSFAVRLGRVLPGLELVSLNPELGEYFGTSEGVLVVAIPEDAGLGLRSGDVILSIGDRAVKSPSHAMRILRSYEPDEEVSFQIMRKNGRMTVEGRVPEPAQRHRMRIERKERR